MCQAFPGSDYYGASVALGVAPFRPSRVPLVADVQDGLGASFVSLRPLEAALFPRGEVLLAYALPASPAAPCYAPARELKCHWASRRSYVSR